jgi:hypothetical protein
MKQKVKFQTHEIAQRFAEHFPVVAIEDNCLTFLKFDQQAFELVVALEQLDTKDYSFVLEDKKDCLSPLRLAHILDRINDTARVNTNGLIPPKPIIELEIWFLIHGNYFCRTFTLLEKPNMGTESILVVTSEALSLITMLHMQDGPPLCGSWENIISKVESISLYMEFESAKCTLTVVGENRSNVIVFYPQSITHSFM